MSEKNKEITKTRERSVDSRGFDYEKQKDMRNVRFKGKHSYNSKEISRIRYIKEKKQKQKEDQSRNSLFRFYERIIEHPAS